jgi:hypothetical protein
MPLRTLVLALKLAVLAALSACSTVIATGGAVASVGIATVGAVTSVAISTAGAAAGAVGSVVSGKKLDQPDQAGKADGAAQATTPAP